MDFAIPYSLCFFLLSMLPIWSNAQSNKNISLGSFLTAQNEGSFWASPSDEFAFGFQQIEKGSYLLAIWFNKLPEKTIVWSANGKNPLQRGSEVRLTANGWFVLNDPTGNQIWYAHTAGNRVSYAAMLNNGNFVLTSQDSVNLWESFDHPTDTILPTQTLNQGSKLVARYSDTNYSNGRFQFTLQYDGNLVLYTTAFPLASVNSAYWSTETKDSGYLVIFNQSGNIYLTAKDRSILTELSSDALSTRDFYQRAVLDFDGVFRHYVYPKSSGLRGRWPMQWSILSFIPSDICMRITEGTGGGACGFNSFCSLGNDQKPNCQCPPGYSILDPNDAMKGCKQNFTSQNCDEASQEADLFDLEEMRNTDWPLSDYEHFKPVTEDWCRQACLSDCFCAVAIFRSGDCWKKKIPLSNGRIDPRVGGKALIKIRKDDSTLNPADEDSKKKDHSTIFTIVSLLLSSSVFLNFLLLVTFLIFFYFTDKKRKMPQPYPVMPGMNLRIFTFQELEKATDGFEEELGRGTFATVYKGVLAFGSENFIAVKKLDKMVREGDKEFQAEVTAIGRTNHKNLVQLLGFCNEGQHRLLVYEFMSNGSLADLLFGNSKPNWYIRMQIAHGTARGLFYLHEECSTQIIHCDIKPQNILLDDNFTARISDFGLAKLLKAEQTETLTSIRGTRGYVAPEWFKNLPITVKVDVYSFGILLLELICCRKIFVPEPKDENQMILTDWAYDCYKDDKLYLLVEDDEEAMDDMRRFKKCVMIAIWCIQEDPSLRPTMKKVTQMLEGAVEVSVPPDPSSFISSNQSL